MDTVLNIDAAGQTTSNGKLKDMTDEQLKKAQKSRQSASGISPKDGGSLTMPAKWRGVVKDNNTSWGDWTNYGFPIHDLSHANNAASRLAQSSSYSSEEKSKIQKRIEAAQNKFKKSDNNMIKVDAKVLDLKAQAISADVMNPDEMMKKSDAIQMMNSMMDYVMSNMRDMYQACMQRDSGIVDSVNSFIDDHTEGHLPSLDNGQKMAIFTAAGIQDQIQQDPTPMNCDQMGIWASALPKDQAEKLNSIKIQVR